MRRKLMAVMIPLAAFCMFAPVTEAKAETVTNDNTYKVEGAYEVSIPATVTVDSSTDSGKLNINGTLNACHNLEITITSDNQYQLVNESNQERKITYKISDDKVVFSNKDGSESKALNYNIDVNVTGTPVVSGTYTDLLKFELNQKDYSPELEKHQLIFDVNLSGTEADTGDVLISTGYKYVTENAQYGMLPTPKRKGYTFLGWFSDASEGTEIKETDVMENQDTTVYAHWRANVLTLHYHSGGAQERQYYRATDFTPLPPGKDDVETETVAYDAKYQHYDWGLLNVSRLKKAGYHPYDSDGTWRVGSPESEFVVSASAPTEPLLTGKEVAEYLHVLDKLEAGDTIVELYPVFYPNEYTVQYVANAEGATGTTESTKHTYDVASELAKNGFTREGYTFDCWVIVYSENDKKTFQDGEMVSNLTDKNNVTITLYARWKEITASDDSANDTEAQTIQNTPDTLNQGSSISEERTTSDDASHEDTSTESEEILESEQPTIKSEESPEPETLESGSVESIEPEQPVTESVTQENIASE